MAFSFTQFSGFFVLIFASLCFAQVFEEISNTACFVRTDPYSAIECATLCTNRYGVLRHGDRDLYIATGIVTDDGTLGKCSCRLTIGLYNYLLDKQISPDDVSKIWYVRPEWAHNWINKNDKEAQFIPMSRSSRNVEDELEEFEPDMYRLPDEREISVTDTGALTDNEPYSVVTLFEESQLDPQWAGSPPKPAPKPKAKF